MGIISSMTGENVAAARVRQLARLLHVKAWPAAQKPFLNQGLQKKFPADLAVVADGITEAKLNELFLLPITAIIDANALDSSVCDFCQKAVHNPLKKGVGFLLTSPVIYATDVAKIFTRALQERLRFSQRRAEDIQIALHEAMVNGLMHGNLQLSSDLRQSARDFIRYAQLLNERLNNPAYARKSISICAAWNDTKLEIKIRDEGVGYEAMPVTQAACSVRAKSGRGLKIIAGKADSCTIDDFGREITLSFLMHEDSYQQAQAPDADAPERKPHVPDLSQCRVLVVEDNPSTQAVIQRLLNVISISQVEIAADGIEGLNKVISYKPDLIVLDITMPRMNGYEVLYHLKSALETRDIPVLVQTASDNRETREKTFSSGATDFISKPVNPLEFFARVKVHLENRLFIRSLEEQLTQIEAELKAARLMQEGMLPSPDSLRDVRAQYGLDIAQSFVPSSALGGDFWQLFPLSETRLGIYLCDFSGHGVAAALNTFRVHAIISQLSKKAPSPAAFLRALNGHLVDLLPRGQFATFFYGILDREKNKITYAGAGVPAPILYAGKKKISLKTRGIPLGITRAPDYQNQSVSFKDGQQIVLFSDALVESGTLGGAQMSVEKWESLIAPHVARKSAQEALDAIMKDFFAVVPAPPPDDATVVFIRAEKR